MNCTGVASRNMTYLPTCIGSHAPPTVLASHSAIASGIASMNGGTIAMSSSGIETASEKMNMRFSAA